MSEQTPTPKDTKPDPEATLPCKPSAAPLEVAGLGRLDQVLGEDAAELPDPDHRYRLTGELGRGGMGIVLAGRDGTFRRDVAIKVMLAAGAGPRQIARFLSEAQIQAQLDHPNICPVHELGLDAEGRPYFTMKLVRGESLGQVLRRVPDLDHVALTDRLRIFIKACDAVAFAHSRGVVHRDLKPGNIMVGAFGEVLVMDWGVARILDDDEVRDVETLRHDDGGQHSLEGEVLGTPAYMPPEQARGDAAEIGPHTDVYSLGAILYRILCGEAPYRGDTAAETIELARVGGWVPLVERMAGRPLPRELAAVVEKAMAMEPADRYASAAAMAEDVQAWLDGRTLVAATYSPLQWLALWTRRYRAAVVAALLVVVAVGASIGFSQWRAAAELRAAEDATLRSVAELNERRHAAEVAVAAVVDAGPSLREPNGELVSSAVDAWYDAHDALVAILEQLSEIGVSAKSGRVAQAVDVDGLSSLRQVLC
ncbi:MAG: hypothetical protein CMJ83_10240, partial [Planctomycetes bacterium]|nr:hypothetical protein [Planctomycetota bacterium]